METLSELCVDSAPNSAEFSADLAEIPGEVNSHRGAKAQRTQRKNEFLINTGQYKTYIL